MILAFYISKLEFIARFHISALIIGVCIGIVFSKIFFIFKNTLEGGINFSAKKFLRLGIILFGFNVSLDSIINIGLDGFLLALGIVVCVFLAGLFFGIKILKLDKETSILISVGSAVCGAAAILAMESILKSKPYKGILALSCIVIFGLIGMFLFPIVLNLNILPLEKYQIGLFLGASLHEVANVVGASGAFVNDDIVEQNAIIIKMIRVILLVPLLLVTAYFLNKGESKKIEIPYFAILFLLVIILNYFIKLPNEILDFIKLISQILLVFAMTALGLQIDFSKIKTMGLKVFMLGFKLFIFLAILTFLLIKII